MKSKKILKIAGILLAAGLLLQTGILAYTSVFTGGNDSNADTSKVIVAAEVQNLIKAQEPSEFDKNLNNYKRMIVLLNVHDTFKAEIEKLISESKKATDIMIAYTYLNDCYGKMAQVAELVNKKAAGRTWQEIFSQYESENPAFKPRSFDFDYLDSLSKKEGITADDIMIADMVSQNADMPFEEVIQEKVSGKAWKDINAALSIINGQDAMPRVPVTPEQLEKYASGESFNEDRVVQTLVTAFKLGLDEKAAIDKAKAGYTTAEFFAEALEKKYN